MRIFVVMCALFALSGCLIVDDFAGKWDAAKPDPCLERIADSIYYQAFQRKLETGEISALTRGMALDGQHFLLLKKHADDKGGYLYRFEIENSVYTQFRLSPTMRKTFQEKYPDASVVIEHDTVTLPQLDEPTMQLLLEIAADARYWEKQDAHLYNPFKNPACLFDDRTQEEKE